MGLAPGRRKLTLGALRNANLTWVNADPSRRRFNAGSREYKVCTMDGHTANTIVYDLIASVPEQVRRSRAFRGTYRLLAPGRREAELIAAHLAALMERGRQDRSRAVET